MRIHSITLENIRSYISQKIIFPPGSILLSGDVGSGKSSILLALDFALFGLRIGSLSGGSLLRNGTLKGNVELNLDIDNVPITIKRYLRKTGNTINQDPGYLIVQGTKYNLSPIELKDRILQLLHYPREFLTKHKSLIYLYTVYTPQEEMKYILLSDKENRLEILRKVFGIDKYKRIKDNAKIFISYLKGRRKELAGRIADLSEKQDLYTEKEQVCLNLKKQIKILDEEILAVTILLKKQEETFLFVQKQVEEFRNLKSKLEVSQLHFDHKKKRKNEILPQLSLLEEQIVQLESELHEPNHVDPQLISEKEALVQSLQISLREKNAKLGALRNRIHTIEEIKNKIQTLDICPTCKQKVTPQHIQEVIISENTKLISTDKEISTLLDEIKKTENNLTILTQQIGELQKQINILDSFKLKKNYLDEKKSFFRSLQEESVILENDLKLHISEQQSLQEKILLMKDVETVLEKHITKKQEYFEQQKYLELNKNTLDTQLHTSRIQLKELEEEIKRKLKGKDELLRLTSLQDWIENKFIEMMAVIEKHILSKVHTDFNHFFQKWFSLLIEEDNIKVILDEEFSPLIEQNGHIIDYTYLSGGEKTAAALAYRLALNQVINLLMSVIKTRDLLILDEPTDGFSEIQIDRMRTILRELDMSQIIIVSHENKIETFVDHVIQIRKNDHITEIGSP